MQSQWQGRNQSKGHQMQCAESLDINIVRQLQTMVKIEKILLCRYIYSAYVIKHKGGSISYLT